MAETQKSDQDRLIDETLSLFQNAIAETKTVLPPVQFVGAVEPKDVPPSEPPEKRAASLIRHAVSIARTVAGFVPKAVEAASPPSLNTPETAVLSPRQTVAKPDSEYVLPLEQSTQDASPSLIDHADSLVKKVVISEPKAVQTASPSLQPSVAKQASEKSVGDARSDPLVDQALSMVAIVPIDESNMVEAASPPSLNTAEAAVLSLLQSVDKLASNDVLPLERPTQEEPPSLIDPAHSLVKKVVISEQKAVSVKEVAFPEHKPVGDARSDPLVDQVMSMVAIVPIDESNMVEASAPSLNTAEAAALSLQQTVAKPASEHVLPLEQSTQEAPPSLIDHAHSTLVGPAPTALKTEAPVPLPQQPLMIQLSPKERLDMGRAEIRKRVVAFRHHQQRFQRDREEYYATTMSKARTILRKAET
jgi:hypothetical protein